MVGSLPRGAKRYISVLEDPDEPTARRRRACIDDAGTRYFEVPQQFSGTEVVRPTVHLSMDLCSASWPSANFLIRGAQYRGTVGHDLFHRWHCDLTDAISECGMTLVRLEMSSVMTTRRKPWGKEGNHNVLLQAAEELDRTGAWHDDLFQLCYPQIAWDMGETGPDFGTEDHMQAVWKQIMSELRNANIGYAVKSSRWWRIEDQHDLYKRKRAGEHMLLCYIGFKRRWWNSFHTCPLFSTVPVEAGDAVARVALGLEGLEQPVDEGPGDEGEAEEPIDDDGVQDARMSVASGRRAMQERRKQCVSQLMFSARCLGRRRSVRAFDSMVVLTGPLKTAFKIQETMVGTRRGTKALLLKLVEQKQDPVIYDTMALLRSPELLHEAQITRRPLFSHSLAGDKELVQILYTFAIRLCGSLALSAFKYTVPPLSFVKLVSPTEEDKTQGLAERKRSFDAIQKTSKQQRGMLRLHGASRTRCCGRWRHGHGRILFISTRRTSNVSPSICRNT